MKAVAIVGFKNSGKSYLVKALAKILRRQGFSVGIIKHAHAPLDIVEKDRPFYACADTVAIIADRQVSTLRKASLRLEEILAQTNTDFILVEGFKQHKTLPRIVCYNSLKEKKELSCGLEIGFVKNGDISDIDVKKLAKVITGKAFKLPGIDCGKCGFKTCFDLAKEIVRQKQKPSACVYSNSKARLWLDDKPIFLNFFVEDIFRNVVSGFVSSLKGAKKTGKIKIEIAS